MVQGAAQHKGRQIGIPLALALHPRVVHGVTVLGPGSGEHLAGRVVDSGAPFACPRGQR